MSTGIRDARIVLFDNGTRMLFATHFETDWDPYIDDVVLVIGMRYFLDWMEHVVEGDRIHDWAQRSGITKFDVNDPSLEELMKRSGGEFKVIIQDTQIGPSMRGPARRVRRAAAGRLRWAPGFVVSAGDPG